MGKNFFGFCIYVYICYVVIDKILIFWFCFDNLNFWVIKYVISKLFCVEWVKCYLKVRRVKIWYNGKKIYLCLFFFVLVYLKVKFEIDYYY